MKKLFSKRVAILAIIACCSLSLMSFSDNEEFYGVSNNAQITNDPPGDEEGQGILPAALRLVVGASRYAYNAGRAACPYVVDAAAFALRHATTMAKNEYGGDFNLPSVSTAQIQVQKFKKLG